MTKSPTASPSTSSNASPKVPPVELVTDTTKHIDHPIDQSPLPPLVTDTPTVPTNKPVVHPHVPLEPETEPFIPTPCRRTAHLRNTYKLKRN